jgi:hypothetical protein
MKVSVKTFSQNVFVSIISIPKIEYKLLRGAFTSGINVESVQKSDVENRSAL